MSNHNPYTSYTVGGGRNESQEQTQRLRATTAFSPQGGARVASSTATGSDDINQAREDAQELSAAAAKSDPDVDQLKRLLERCKSDQTSLQTKLESALEDPNIGTNLELIFSVNEELLNAIAKGKEIYKSEKKKRKKKKAIEGPSIELLVVNEDVFSLICMLRAPSEKRLAASLALMKFAKENAMLRNEIRSSGGMHSFLTLFRGKNTSGELKVVSAMAVAYVLPMFVTKSTVTNALAGKFLECLRFLTVADPVSPQDVVISRKEMYNAASDGVNALWNNTIKALVAIQQSKTEDEVATPTLLRSTSSRYLRTRARTSVQNQEGSEIKVLMETSVTLITNIAKATNEMNIDTAYDIVADVCEVDVARSVSVREGLLSTIIEWLRSRNLFKMRPAAEALRHLISIEDQYVAGWIHSQLVNEGAVNEIVKLFNESISANVREAVAQMISVLCQTAQTRTAVVEARCVSYLVALLYEHNEPESENMVNYAASALLRLAGGGILQGEASSQNYVASNDQESVVSEIIEGWAHGSFVQIALEHQGPLRSVSIEALRVLSEDTNLKRQTRLQLCGAGAAEAIGKTLRDSSHALMPLKKTQQFGPDFRDPDGALVKCAKDVHEALRALANILEPLKGSDKYASQLGMNPTEMLIKCCIDIVRSEGMESLVWIASLPSLPSPLSELSGYYVDRSDLILEACRSLSNLSPYFLSNLAASSGAAKWTIKTFETLNGILHTVSEDDESLEVKLDALRGIGSLAEYEPLKIRIVDKTLAKLLEIKTSSEDDSGEMENAANQVLLSLGLTENEITEQLAGKDPTLLVDWFCLQRSLAIQAMVREELRAKISEMWQLPLSDSDFKDTMLLLPPQESNSDMWGGPGGEIFENFTNDSDSYSFRQYLGQQYYDIYHNDINISRGSIFDESEESLLKSQVYPVNHAMMERNWILNHRRDLEAMRDKRGTFCGSGFMPERIESLLDKYFPCNLLRSLILPVNDFCPSASFDFRALMMPQRRYRSFRREGQLLARLCERQVATINSVDVHWTLGFTNSSFEGEFVESLVQSLYLCPMITGLSFVNNSDSFAFGGNSEADGDGETGLLADLTGSLPPWVSYLTFDNVLSDKDLKALVAIFETMGKLAAPGRGGKAQGKFKCISICNSPNISRETWSAFFQTFGKTNPSSSMRNPAPMPLSTLKVLDLSGNKLGDEASALILELLHEKESGCIVEKLDLSGNRIGRGENIIRVLQSYTEYYRYNQKQGLTSTAGGWKSSLDTLNLGENDLFLGQLPLEILALLQHNALCLKYLDLSNNGLEGDDYQLVAIALPKNDTLSHLDLSGNKFSSPLIDFILHHLSTDGVEDDISFLLFDNNVPALSPAQQENLNKFLRKTRKMAIESHVKGQDAGETEDQLAAVPPRFDATASMLGPVDSGDNMITVLFSAPLVFADEENMLHPFAKLDFDMERELLWQCMKEASRDIELSFDNAHHSRLLATLTKRCSCLHYSGHGHEMFLPFEDGMGGPNWLNVQDIKELIIRDGVAPFKFVFVSACHSGLAGETFASAGVPHVVCCRQEYELKDTAALAFTRSFYLALAVGNTVKESFEQGCKAVRATPNLKDPEKEMEKFVLLPKDGNHNVPVFQARRVSQWPKPADAGPRGLSKMNSRRTAMMSAKSMRSRTSIGGGAGGGAGAKSTELNVRNMIQEDPAPSAPNFFLGREVDMYYVLTAILKMKKRLITVLGEAGIGKSALVCALCHYMNERATTVIEVEHMYFIKPKRTGRNKDLSCHGLVRQLMDKVVEAGKMKALDPDTDTETMLDAVCRALKNDKALIVFNSKDLLEDEDAFEEMPMILNTLLYDTKQVKVVLTARQSLGQPSIGGQVEHPFQVGPLNLENTVRLFVNLCPHLYTASERNQILKTLVHDNEYADAFPTDDWLIEPYRSIYAKLGNGNPAKIEKAAYTISMNDLREMQNV